MAAERAFIETKRRPDGTAQSFQCALIAHDGRTAVARYVYPRDFIWHGCDLPRGGRTDAWFWGGRRYLLYRMYGANGEHILDRFDVVDDVRLRRDGVEYRDLYLDVWIDRSGEAQIDDEDELQAAHAAGLLTAEERRAAERTARLLVRDHAPIIAAAERWLATR